MNAFEGDCEYGACPECPVQQLKSPKLLSHAAWAVKKLQQDTATNFGTKGGKAATSQLEAKVWRLVGGKHNIVESIAVKEAFSRKIAQTCLVIDVSEDSLE